MTIRLIERLAEYIVSSDVSTVDPQTLESTRLHILDTIGSFLVGSESRHGQLLVRIWNDSIRKFEGMPNTLLDAVSTYCGVTRSTEIDDIHLESCTTPGAAIVPTALLLASKEKVPCTLFMNAVIAGYDVMTRLGSALDGPVILYKGIWPTLLCATAGCATVASKILQLNTEETAQAIATALSISCSSNPPSQGKPTRPFLMGISCRNGVYSALASRENFRCDTEILEGEWSRRIRKDQIDEAKLIGGLGRLREIRNVSFKIYSCGKQQMTSIEAFGKILATRVNPNDIESVRIFVPRYYKNMIAGKTKSSGHSRNNLIDESRERPAPQNVAYRLGLLAYHPASLFARDRDIQMTPEISSFIPKVSIFSDKKLERYYPKAWPARVVVKTNHRIHEETVIYATGDPKSKNQINRDKVAEKFRNFLADTPSMSIFDRLSKNSFALPDESAFAALLKDMNEIGKRIFAM